MSILIEMMDERSIFVNDKCVRKDMEGRWIGPSEGFAPEEAKAFDNFRQCLERCPKLRRAEYTI